jgi:hypothetical protein
MTKQSTLRKKHTEYRIPSNDHYFLRIENSLMGQGEGLRLHHFSTTLLADGTYFSKFTPYTVLMPSDHNHHLSKM